MVQTTRTDVKTTPERLGGSQKGVYVLYIEALSTNTGTISIGGQGEQQVDIPPGRIITFNIGECDLDDDWYIKGTVANDKYVLLTIPKERLFS